MACIRAFYSAFVRNLDTFEDLFHLLENRVDSATRCVRSNTLVKPRSNVPREGKHKEPLDPLKNATGLTRAPT
jgi:hypothetical protein